MDNDLVLNTVSGFGTSGRFIHLVQSGKSSEFQPLWRQISVLSQRLFEAEQALLKINDPNWLFQFENLCRRENQEFSNSLIQKSKQFEQRKNLIQTQLNEARELIDKIQPGLSESTHSLVPRAAVSRGQRTPQHRLPAVAARNVVIHRYANKSDQDICRALDHQENSNPIPPTWTDRFGVTTWHRAYLNAESRKLVHKLISKERARG